ncbi:hypothetical protein HYX17_04435 [Candidatus Woesearchaeota archaeon]|nr:hypothetical protein [Candidatus Woesearchaeota archaeon]
MKLLILLLLAVPLVYAQCNGCDYNGKCINVGTQVLTSEYGEPVYCSSDRKIESAKNENDVCLFDYECRSFFCDDECKAINYDENFSFVYLSYGIIFILIAILIFALLKSIKFKRKKRTNILNKKPIKVELKSLKKKPNRYDKLDVNINSSMEKLNELFKRK